MEIVTRHRIMAAVPQKNSEPELLLRRELHAMGLRYRLHVAGLPGRPDVVFPKYKTALFVHGCFWHRHQGCPRTTTPKNNYSFWQSKFDANIARDKRACNQLAELGWISIIVWECDILRDPALVASEVAVQLRALGNRV